MIRTRISSAAAHQPPHTSICCRLAPHDSKKVEEKKKEDLADPLMVKLEHGDYGSHDHVDWDVLVVSRFPIRSRISSNKITKLCRMVFV
jgi:hypothetical protein